MSITGTLSKYGEIIYDGRKLDGMLTMDPPYDPTKKTIFMTNTPITGAILNLPPEELIHLIYEKNGFFYYLNNRSYVSTAKPPHVFTNPDDTYEIKGSAGFVVVHDQFKNITGFILVKDRTKNYLTSPVGGVEANSNHLDTVIREIKEETSINVNEDQIKDIGGWNCDGNFCGEKHPCYTKLFRVDVYLTNLELLRILKYSSDEISEVVFIGKDFVQNNPVKKVRDQIVSPTVTLQDHSVCVVSPHYLLPAMKLMGMSIEGLVPGYIWDFEVNF